MKTFKWLYPGLKVKRWLALSFLGLLVALTGLVMMVTSPAVVHFAFQIRSLIFGILGLLPSLVSGSILALLGLLISLFGFQRMMRSVVEAILPSKDEHLVEVLYNRRYLERGPKVVAIGGGTGQSVLLRGLKGYTSNITAIVAVSDDGGSSGRLRGELGILPPGDIRNCLVALADTESLMEEVFNYRFHQGSGLSGHSLGNLFLAGMTDITGGFDRAIREMSRVLAVRGRVFPSTLSDVVLVAELADGTTVEGQTTIKKSGRRIRRVTLKPAGCHPQHEALQAIMEADAVILGPGSLYTSILPNLVIPEIADALRRTKAPVFYICNVMTEPGETDHYTAGDHLQAIEDHCGPGLVDCCVVNTTPLTSRWRQKQKPPGVAPVTVDAARVARAGVRLIRARLADDSNPVRHHPDRLAHAILAEIFRRPNAAKQLGYLHFRISERIRKPTG